MTRLLNSEAERSVTPRVDALTQLQHVVSEHDEAVQIGRIAAERIRALSGAGRVLLYQWVWADNGEATLQLFGAAGEPFDPRHDQAVRNHAAGFWRSLRERGEAILVVDAARSQLPTELVNAAAFRDLIAVPIHCDERQVGFLIAEHWPTGDQPTLDLLPPLMEAARGIAATLTHARVSLTAPVALPHVTTEDDSQASGTPPVHQIIDDLDPRLSELALASFEQLLPELANRITHAVRLDQVSLFVYDTHVSEVIAGYLSSSERVDAPGGATCTPLADVRGPWRTPIQVPAERHMLQTNAHVTDTVLLQEAMRDPNLHAALTPLRSNGVIVGALWAFRSGQSPFADSDIAALVAIGNAAGPVVDRVRTVEADQRHQHHAETLLDIAVTLNGAQPMRDLVVALAELVARALQVDVVSVFAYDETVTRTIEFGHYGADHDAHPGLMRVAPTDVPVEAHVIETGQMEFRNGETRFVDPYRPDDWRSDVVVPIMADSQVQGVLYARNRGRERRFSVDDRELLEAIARVAGPGLRRARNSEIAERRAERLALIHRVGRALAGTVEVDALCVIVDELVGQVLPADAFFVGFIDVDAGVIRIPYVTESGERLPAIEAPLDKGPCGEVVRTGLPYITRRNDPLYASATRFGDPNRRVAEAMHVPMVWDGHLLGIVSVQSVTSGAYTDDDLSAFETITQQAAAAFAHAQLHSLTVDAKNDAERHVADLETVLRVSQTVASSGDLNAMLNAMADALARLVRHDVISVHRLTEDERTLECVFARRHGQSVDPERLRMEAGQGLVGVAMRRGQALLVNDAHNDPRSVYPLDGDAIAVSGEHAIQVPLIVMDQTIGVLHLSRFRRDPFRRDELTFCELLGAQTAVALRNAMLLEDARAAHASARRQAEQLSALLTVAHDLNTATEPRATLATFAHELGRLVPFDEISIYQVGPDELLHPIHFEKFHQAIDVAHWALRPDQGLVGHCFTTGEAAHIPDAHLDLRSIYVVDDQSYQTLGEHVIQAPLIVAGKTLGVVHVSRIGGEPFTDEEFTTLCGLAEHAAVALRNGSLLAEARDAHAATSREAANFAAVLAVTRSIITTDDLSDTIAVLADELLRLVPHDEVALYTLDAQTGVLRSVLHRHYNDPIAIDQPVWTLLLGEGLVGRAAMRGRAELVNDAHDDSQSMYEDEERGHYERLGEHAVVAPLVVGGAVTGVLYANRVGGSPFRSDEFGIFTALAEQAAAAIRNASLLAEARVSSQRAERESANLAAVLSVTRALNSAGDLEGILDLLMAELGHLVRYDEFTLFQPTPDGSRLVSRVHRQRIGDHLIGQPTFDIPIGAGLVGASHVSGRAELVNYAHRDPRSVYPITGEWPSDGEHLMVVPLLAGGRVTGVLTASRWGNAPFATEEFTTFQALAEQAAVALHNAALLVESQRAEMRTTRHAANLAAVLAVTKALTSAGDLDAVLGVLSRELSALIPVDEITICQHDAETNCLVSQLHLHIVDNDHVTQPPYRLPLGTGLMSGVYLGRRAQRINNAHLNDRAYYPVGETHWRERGEHTMMVPLSVLGEVTGVLTVSRYGGQTFSDEEFSILQILAEQAAVALHSAALLAASQDAQERSVQHVANLEAVLETAHSITSQHDLVETLRTLAAHLERLVPHQRFIVWRLTGDGETLQPFVAYADGKAISPDWTLPAGVGIIGRVMEEREPRLINRAHLDPAAVFPDDYPRPLVPEHLLVSPLTTGQRVVGAIVLDRSGAWTFSAQDLAVFRVLAGQAEIAVQASLLIEEERRRHRHATALVDVASTLNRALTLDDLLDDLSAMAARAVAVDRCSVYVYDPSRSSSIAASHFGASQEEQSLLHGYVSESPRVLPVERELMDTGRLVVGERLRELLETGPADLARTQLGGAAIPFRAGDTVVGAMYIWAGATLTEGAGRDFDDDELALLEAIGEQAGAAIERARLHNETERRVAELRVLGAINAAITQSLAPGEIIAHALELVRAIIPFDLGAVVMWNVETEELRVLEVWGRHAERFRGQHVPLEGSISGAVFRTGQAAIHDIEDGHPHYIPDEGSPIGQYTMCVPLRSENREIGVLNAIRDAPGPYTESDLALFELVTGYMAVGIERAQIFEVALDARTQSERQAKNLEAVLAASQRLALLSDVETGFPALVDGLYRLVTYSACAVYRLEGNRMLRRVYDDARERPEIILDHSSDGAGLLGRAIARRQTMLESGTLADWDSWPSEWFGRAALAEFAATPVHAMAVPLLVEGQPLGVLAITRLGERPFDDEERATVQVYAGQAAAVVRNADLLARNRDLYLGGIRALASAVDAKDAYTRGHSERVSRLARMAADALNLERGEAEAVELAGLLHDIGKIGIPDAILQKPGRLDESEQVVMMGHAALGAAIILDAQTDSLLPLVPLVRHHHEWHDGGGYPDGLAGDDVPLGAAIIAVADAFDTIVTDRPYRMRRSTAEAIEELCRASGTQFHPRVVATFAELVEREVVGGVNQVDGEVSPPRPDWGDWSVLDGDLAVSPATANGAMPTGVAGEVMSAVGRIGDLRALGLLIELASMTRDIPDLQSFLNRVTAMVRRRLGYEDVMLMLVDQDAAELYVAACSADHPEVFEGHRQPLDVGVCGQVIQDKRPRNIPDITADPDVYLPIPNLQGSELIVPLVVDDEAIGLINVESTRVAAFTAADLAVLTAVAEQVATAVHVAQLHAAARHAAITDGLTGLLNHRGFYESFEAAIATDRPLCVILFDVEGLKQVNDTVGHLAGDQLLRTVARMISTRVGVDDLVARYGGDEFAVVMLDGVAGEAEHVAAAVRQALLDQRVGEHTPRVTVRYGVAMRHLDGDSMYDLLEAADRRLYAMRAQSGRSRDHARAAVSALSS